MAVVATVASTKNLTLSHTFLVYLKSNVHVTRTNVFALYIQ